MKQGYAFVIFAEHELAERAIKLLDNVFFFTHHFISSTSFTVASLSGTVS